MSNDFSEIYEVELECWCYGLRSVRGTVESGVIYKVIRDFAPVLREAVEQNYVADILATAQRFIKAARSTVSEKEVAFYILSQLPFPAQLNDAQQTVLNQIIDGVEHVYSGALERLEKKWKSSPNTAASHAAKNCALPALGATLAFPPKTNLARH